MLKISKTSMNKVEFNKSQLVTSFSPEFLNKIRDRKKQETQEKTERVETRRIIFDTSQLNKKNFEIIKHDLAKNCLDYYRNLQNHCNLVNQWKKNWILIVLATIKFKEISEYTEHKYHEKKKLLKVAFGLQKFQLKYRRMQRLFGEDKDERIRWDSKGLIFINFFFFILFS